MKKILTMLGICLIISCSLIFAACKKEIKPQIEVWDGTITDVSTAVDKKITIESAEELAGLAKEVNNGNTFEGLTIKLDCDIDLMNRDWTPIGYGYLLAGPGIETQVLGKPFNGTFDGQNHTIYNLNIVGKNGGKNEGSAGVGLFGFVQGAVINLKIENSKVLGNHYVGTIAGYVADYDNMFIGEISNCHVKNAKVSCVYLNDDESGDKAGSIAGLICASNLINCSANNVFIDADRDAGQLIGCLIYCENYDYITGNKIQNVNVEWNKSGELKSENTGKNIKNEFFGKQ